MHRPDSDRAAVVFVRVPFVLAWALVPRRRRLLAALAGLAVIGCGPPHPPLSAQATNALRRVDADPPPGRVESVPDRPEGADAWIDGEWVLQHGRWYWLLGRWVKAPKGATYSPWVVVRARDGTLFYAPSVWRDANGEVIPAPPALGYAAASGGGIVSPEGDLEPTGRSIKTPPRHRPPPDEGTP